MALHKTEAERRGEVEGWRRSGLSAGRYAASRGYSETTLRKWSGMEATATAPGATTATAGLVRLIPRSSELAEREDAVVVEVGAARIRVGPGFDAALLRAVVIALSEEAS